MTWKFSWDSTTITFPRNPSKVTVKYTSVTKSIPMPGDYPLVISQGKQTPVLTVEGLLAESGKTIEQLYNDYLSPLIDRLYKEITVDADDSRYDGTYILTSLTYYEVGGVTRAVRYKMEFIKGSQHIIL